MAISRNEAREEVVQHYMETRGFTRKQAEDYIHDDDRVFWLLEEVQKEREEAKRIGKRPHFQTEDGFIFYETYYLDEEDEPIGS